MKKKKTTNIGIRLSDEVKDALITIAETDDRTLSKVVERLIKKEIKAFISEHHDLDPVVLKALQDASR